MRHSVLQTDHHPVSRETRLDKLTGPTRVIGLHHKENDVERLADLGDLARCNAGTLALIVRVGKFDGYAAFANGNHMLRPLLDEGYVQTSQSEVGADRGPLRACPRKATRGPDFEFQPISHAPK